MKLVQIAVILKFSFSSYNYGQSTKATIKFRHLFLSFFIIWLGF